MFFFTHLVIADILYQNLEVELNKRAFSYGNIKPDLPSEKRNHHTLENYLGTVSEYSKQLMENEMTIEEFSVRLGEACHYVSDFFCYYHLNEDLHNKSFQHFLYEIRLHFEMLYLRFRKKYVISPSDKEPRKNISSIILELRKAYLSQPKSYERDIEYALLANIWICESILYYTKNSLQVSKEDKQTLNSILFAKDVEF